MWTTDPGTAGPIAKLDLAVVEFETMGGVVLGEGGMLQMGLTMQSHQPSDQRVSYHSKTHTSGQPGC